MFNIIYNYITLTQLLQGKLIYKFKLEQILNEIFFMIKVVNNNNDYNKKE